MPGQRGVARRTTPRRRTRRTRIKAGYPVTVRRFKMLGFLPTDPMPVELDWELWVLDKLEQECYAFLAPYGFSKEVQDYYLGFVKRLWERRVDFALFTFAEEKESLIQEYILRGLDEATLRALQVIAESWAVVKGAPWLRVPRLLIFEDWGYIEPPSMNLLFSESWVYDEPPSMTQKFIESWVYDEPPSMTQKFVEAWSS